MHEPLTLPVAEFDAAWKYLDNMYIPNTCRRAKSAPTVTTYYSCRLWRKETHATVTPEKRKRNKPSRVAIGCPCRLKTITDERAMTITFTRKTPPHNHEYPELDGKLSTGAKELLRREVVKGYSTPYLARAMKEEKYGTWQYMKAAGGGGLTQKDVMNAVQTYRREHPDAKGDIDIQVKDLVTLLLLKYWFVSEIKTENAHGVVFSHMDGLSGLRRRGCLVLTETADQMSRLQWRLTSFTIRDEYGSWVPAAFFLRDSLDTELMKMAFSQLRTWCADQWPLRYIISDGSMGGQDVANSIFEGQDRKVTHYFSTIHSERLLRQYFGKILISFNGNSDSRREKRPPSRPTPPRSPLQMPNRSRLPQHHRRRHSVLRNSPSQGIHRPRMESLRRPMGHVRPPTFRPPANQIHLARAKLAYPPDAGRCPRRHPMESEFCRQPHSRIYPAMHGRSETGV